jgi:hypothetical protein
VHKIAMLKDCREIKSLLPDFLSNRTDVKEQKAVQEHIDGCVSCRQEALALKETFQALEGSRTSIPSAAYWTNFLPRLHERLSEVGRTKQESAPWVTKFLFPAAGLIVAVVLIARIEIVPGSKGSLSEVRQLVEQMDTTEFQRLTEASSDPLFPELSSRLEVSLSRDEEAHRAINSLIATSGDEVIQLREVSLHGWVETGLEDLTDEEMEAVIQRLESRGTL